MSEKKTPEQWEAEYGLEVRDPDGWRRDNTPWEQPLTLRDFWRRYAGSTARPLTTEGYDRIIADVETAMRQDGDAAEPEQLDARRTDHPWPAGAPSVEQKIDTVLQQLNTLLGVIIQCAACVADARQGTGPNVNLANVIIGGEGLCHAHVDLVGTRLVRRNSSGLIINGG